MNSSGSFRFRSLTWVFVLLLSVPQINAAGPLRLKLSTVTSSIRSDAPLSLNVHLDWASPDLVEGRLELSCFDGETLLHRSLGSEVALFAGDRHSRTILPPMSLSRNLSALTVRARFLTETSDYDLGSFDLRVPVFWQRSFVIGVVVPRENAHVAGSAALGQSLRLDQLGENEIPGGQLVSIPSEITPDDLRASGLGLFSFDVLALTGPGFNALSDDQLDAISGWVEAGGSLFVSVDGTNSPAQVRFLNRMAGIPDDDPRLTASADGLPSDGHRDRSGRLWLCRPGMGRSVLFQSEESAETVIDLREAAAHLWKIRSKMQAEFRQVGTSEQLSKRLLGAEADQSDSGHSERFDDSALMYSPFQQVRLSEMDSLSSILLPSDVRSIPLSVVILILALFLTAIVPIDYFVLGHFNCRRFTWLLVPVVSLVFTGFTASLGSAYLGSTDYRTSLEVVDLTTGNRVVRSSRFEMLFTATSKEVATELKQTLYASVTLRGSAQEDESKSSRGLRNSNMADVPFDTSNQPRDTESPPSEGNMPALFTVRQQMRKWSPEWSRQTALQTERPIPQFDLDDISKTWQQSPELLSSPEWQRSLLKRVRTVLPESAVLLISQNQVLELTRTDELPEANAQKDSLITRDRPLLELVRKSCIRQAVGLFSIVSQISPNAAGDFEDLSIVDSDDANQLLVVIVARLGNDCVVFRRLFHKGM